jgi:inner membrane protein
MPTIISHAVVGAVLVTAFPAKSVPRRLAVTGAACAMAPDIDVIGFHFGIHYGDLLGHRGLTHSIMFAIALAFTAQFASTGRARLNLVWLYLFLTIAEHGLLDAFTNGGLGVAFFSPFSNARYFFPLRPIGVSPIGAGFLSARGLEVLLNEIQWVWLPSFAFFAVAFLYQTMLRRQGPVD